MRHHRVVACLFDEDLGAVSTARLKSLAQNRVQWLLEGAAHLQESNIRCHEGLEPLDWVITGGSVVQIQPADLLLHW